MAAEHFVLPARDALQQPTLYISIIYNPVNVNIHVWVRVFAFACVRDVLLTWNPVPFRGTHSDKSFVPVCDAPLLLQLARGGTVTLRQWELTMTVRGDSLAWPSWRPEPIELQGGPL